jgi:hypothetical protein
MKNPSFIKTQMINEEVFAFPKKIKKDSILRMDLELCMLDPFLLNDINEYPDPAKQIVGIILKERTPPKKKKVEP